MEKQKFIPQSRRQWFSVLIEFDQISDIYRQKKKPVTKLVQKIKIFGLSNLLDL